MEEDKAKQVEEGTFQSSNNHIEAGEEDPLPELQPLQSSVEDKIAKIIEGEVKAWSFKTPKCWTEI